MKKIFFVRRIETFRSFFSREKFLCDADQSDRNFRQQRIGFTTNQRLRIRFRFVSQIEEKFFSFCQIGFRSDYTLARYKSSLHSLIYDHAKNYLVKNLRVGSNRENRKKNERKTFDQFFFSIPMKSPNSLIGRTWALAEFI